MIMKESRDTYPPEAFVTCSQGMEELLAAELEELGCQEVALGYRGVYVRDAVLNVIYRINYCSRLASRVLLPLSRFRCRDRQSLYTAASSIDWPRYIPQGKTIAIDANVSNHRALRNSLYAAQILKDAVCDQFRARFGDRPNVDTQNPDV